MKDRMGLTGEASNHKVAGLFDDKIEAQERADAVRSTTGLDETQVNVLEPAEANVARSLEPESRGILATMMRAHIWLGLAGAVLGLLAFATMMVMDVPFVVLSPLWSAVLLTGFGTAGGMMVGGALTLRPDHTPYVSASRDALRQGRHVVAVHATSTDELKQAERILKGGTGDTVRTL